MWLFITTRRHTLLEKRLQAARQKTAGENRRVWKNPTPECSRRRKPHRLSFKCDIKKDFNGWLFTSGSNWIWTLSAPTFHSVLSGSGLLHYFLPHDSVHRSDSALKKPMSVRRRMLTCWLKHHSNLFLLSQIFCQYTSIHRQVAVCIMSIFMCIDVCVLSQISVCLCLCVCVCAFQWLHLSL